MYIYIVYAIVILALVGLGFILHNSRSSSTKASDYFNNLKDDTNEDDQAVDNVVEEKIAIKEDESIDNRESIRKEQTAQYLMLLEIHKNKIYKKHLQKNIDNVDEDKYKELNGYLSFSELSELLGIDAEETISFFISEGLIERDRYTLVLTEKGIDMGGKYITHEEVTWIEFPKDIFNRLEYKGKPIEPLVKEYKNNNVTSFWVMVIMIVLVYWFIF